MAYVIDRFIDAPIPGFNAQTDTGPGGTQGDFLLMASGASLDLSGSEAPDAKIITLRVTVLGYTDAEWETAVRALHALRGKTGRLWRWWPGSTQREWCMAKLLVVPSVHDVLQVRQATYDLKWRRISPYWYGRYHGAVQALGDGLALDGDLPLGILDEEHALAANASTPLTITNGGDAPVIDAVLTVTAGTAAITKVEGTGPTATWEFVRNIPAGESLVMDVARDEVKVGGVDAYANLTVESEGRTSVEWLLLEPGDNDLTLALTGGGTGSKALLEFWEAHP